MILLPDIKLDKVTDINLSILNSRGIKALILDVDNTLSTHHGQALTEGLLEWISEMHKNKIGLTVLSNSTPKRLTPFAEKIGLPFISCALKPLPFGYLRAVKRLGTKQRETAIVGDQIFTDILGGNLVGINTILINPIKPEDSFSFKFKRRLEQKIIKRYNVKRTVE